MKWLNKLKLYSIIIVPVSEPGHFLDLQYSKLKPNQVKIEKTVELEIDKSASPLFYKFDEVQKHNEIIVKGEVEIKTSLKKEEKDSYFQVGVIYAGDYRPSFLVKKLLPEWLLKILNLNDKHGVGRVDFHHISGNKTNIDKKEKIRDIVLEFKTVGHLNDQSQFEAKIKLKNEKVLGLWLRADGDDEKSQFTTKINFLEIY